MLNENFVKGNSKSCNFCNIFLLSFCNLYKVTNYNCNLFGTYVPHVMYNTVVCVCGIQGNFQEAITQLAMVGVVLNYLCIWWFKFKDAKLCFACVNLVK